MINEVVLRSRIYRLESRGDMVTEKQKIELRQKQWEVAMEGNVQMLIWLGKQVLGQTEQPPLMEDDLVEGFDIEVL